MTYIPDLSDQSTPLVKRWYTTRMSLIASYMRIYNIKRKIEPHDHAYRAYMWTKINGFHLQARLAHKELCERETQIEANK